MSEGANTAAPIWNSCSFGMEMQTDELNCSSGQLANCFLNPNWDNLLDQSDPFESALSSIVSSPVASSVNANVISNAGVGGDSVLIRELIGRLGNICNSGDMSPQSYINNNNNSTNTSCYSTPLNSPPKLSISMMDSQMRGNLPILGNSLVNHPSLAPFPADPGFVERAARYSCFGSNNLGGLNGQFGLNESELINRMMPRVEPGKLSRVSSNNSMKVAGSQANVQESNKSSPQDGNLNSDKKFSRLSRPSTPENGDSREESSVSEQIPGGELSMKSQTDANSRKRKSIPRGKAKETPSPSPSASDVKVMYTILFLCADLCWDLLRETNGSASFLRLQQRMMNRAQKKANQRTLMGVTRIQQRPWKKKMEITNRKKTIQTRQSHQRTISMSEPEGVRLQIATVLLKEYGLIKLCSVICFSDTDRFVLTCPWIFCPSWMARLGEKKSAKEWSFFRILFLDAIRCL